MKKFKSKAEAFASQNYEPAAVTITGVPDRHVEALKAVADLFVLHDAVNPKFQPDFDNRSQYKFQNYFLPGSPSGVGFRFDYAGDWCSYSVVGSRLVSESEKAAEHVSELGSDAYKALMVYQRETKTKSK
jgi:hypothetical protein